MLHSVGDMESLIEVTDEDPSIEQMTKFNNGYMILTKQILEN